MKPQAFLISSTTKHEVQNSEVKETILCDLGISPKNKEVLLTTKLEAQNSEKEKKLFCVTLVSDQHHEQRGETQHLLGCFAISSLAIQCA